MASILEALEMAQERNKKRDVMNTQRQMPVLPIIPTGQVQPIVLGTGGGDGDGGGPPVDNRTDIEKYNDLVAANKYASMAPIIGPALGAIGDYTIQKMEEENPDFRPEDPFSKKARERFSYTGRVFGGYGYPTQEGKMHTTLWDRITGVDPTWAESLARVNQDIPTNKRNWNLGGGDGDDNDGDIGGYSRGSLSFDNPDPRDSYGYA